MADRHSAFGLLFTTLLKLPRHVEVTDDPEVEVAHVRLTKPWEGIHTHVFPVSRTVGRPIYCSVRSAIMESSWNRSPNNPVDISKPVSHLQRAYNYRRLEQQGPNLATVLPGAS